jgi:hypothetical protein
MDKPRLAVIHQADAEPDVMVVIDGHAELVREDAVLDVLADVLLDAQELSRQGAP